MLKVKKLQVVTSICFRPGIAYTCAVQGYAYNGDGRGAASVLERMQQQLIEPDIYTYNALIKAWSTFLRLFSKFHAIR